MHSGTHIHYLHIVRSMMFTLAWGLTLTFTCLRSFAHLSGRRAVRLRREQCSDKGIGKGTTAGSQPSSRLAYTGKGKGLEDDEERVQPGTASTFYLQGRSGVVRSAAIRSWQHVFRGGTRRQNPRNDGCYDARRREFGVAGDLAYAARCPSDNASHDHARTMTLAVQLLLPMLGHGWRQVRCARGPTPK